MKENSAVERLYNGIVKENPTFVLMLGMCPTLAVTTSAINGLGMGLTTAAVLALSNLIISLLRKVIPDKVRIPAFIVIIASFVTVVQLLLEAYLPELNEALGVYIPLIVVNCIILGRAEAYAYSHGPIASLFDGIGMGLGFSLALTCIGGVRELLGAGKLFDHTVMPKGFTPIGIFVLAPGAFFVLAALCALQNFVKIQGTKKGKDMSKIGSGCSHDCMHCGEQCAERAAEENAVVVSNAEQKDGLDKTVEPVKQKAEETAKAETEAETEAKIEAEAETDAKIEAEIKTEAGVSGLQKVAGKKQKHKKKKQAEKTETVKAAGEKKADDMLDLDEEDN